MPARKKLTPTTTANRELTELRSRVDSMNNIISSNLELSKSAIDSTDRTINRMTWIVGLSMSIITLLISVGIGLGIYGTISLPGEVIKQVSEKVPPSVADEVSVAVPNSVKTEISKMIPTVVMELNGTIVAQVVPTANIQIQTQAEISAKTAVNQSLGNFVIVISNDELLEYANIRANYAKGRGYNPTIYKIQKWFVTTVGSYSTVEQLNVDLEKVKIEIEKSAYSLDLKISCPHAMYNNSGYYLC
jgi:hypothetical protein